MKNSMFINGINLVLLGVAMFCFGFKTIEADAGKQVSGGVGWLVQNGKPVGQVYVPDYKDGACYYVEHWFVGKDYVYPGDNNPIELIIQPTTNLKYNSYSEFKSKMKKAFPGGHYIKVEAYEEIPGCPGL